MGIAAKKYSQFTCVHEKSSNRAQLTRVAKPQIKVEYAADFPKETRDAVKGFFLDKSSKTVASSFLQWQSVSFPERASTTIKSGMRVLCRCGASWQTVVEFKAATKPDQAKKRLYAQLAQVPVQPLPQQQVLANEFRDYDFNSQKRRAYMLYWVMGSGKTRGVLEALAAAKHTSASGNSSKVLIVCSNTLIGNWIDTIKSTPQTHGYTNFTIMGYNEFRNVFSQPPHENEMGSIKNYVVIVDEAHYFRNLTPRMREDVSLLRQSKFLFLLTGTPMQNEPSEICAMLALLQTCESMAKQSALRSQTVADDFDCEPETLDRQRASIEKYLSTHKSVFFYDPAIYDAERFKSNYPATEERIERVPMTATQALDYMLSLRASTKLGPYTIQTARRNSYDSLTRAIANVSDPEKPEESPKVRQVGRNVLGSKYPGPHVVFSHYRDRGVHAVDKYLAKTAPKLRRKTISGSTDGRLRDTIVNEYNSGKKIDVLSITDAAREGVDLHGTGTMHVLESAQNLHNEGQTMSRVARFGSHASLPADKQRVVFIKYRSVFPNAEGLEKQRAELEKYFEDTYKLPARGKFDIVKQLLSLFKQMENGDTVDERYARTNQEKAKLLVPWLNMFKRVGNRRSAVDAATKLLPAAVASAKRKRSEPLTAPALVAARKKVKIAPAKKVPAKK